MPANAAQVAAPEIAKEVAGLIEPRLALREMEIPKEGSRGDLQETARLKAVLEAWAHYRTTDAMTRALAATATGSAIEAHDRDRIAKLLRSVRELKVLGTDTLSRKAIELMADGTVRAVDALLVGDAHPIHARFRLDGKGRVVSFEVGH
jgi:hypothetical protein